MVNPHRNLVVPPGLFAIWTSSSRQSIAGLLSVVPAGLKYRSLFFFIILYIYDTILTLLGIGAFAKFGNDDAKKTRLAERFIVMAKATYRRIETKLGTVQNRLQMVALKMAQMQRCVQTLVQYTVQNIVQMRMQSFVQIAVQKKMAPMQIALLMQKVMQMSVQ